jgi:cytoskeletal protein RodZ
MTSIGETLRGERLRRGLKLEQVAAETKIRMQLLEAMEDDRFDRLPPGLLTRSFLRQYTHTLGLNEDEVMACFKERFEKPVDPWPEPEPKPRSHIPHPPELIWVLAATFACVYSLTQNNQRPLAAQGPRLESPQPISRARERGRPSPSQAAVPSESPQLRPTVVADSEPVRTLRRSDHAAVRELAQVPDSARPMRVAFTATEPVWLSVKSDGANAYSGTLGGQESKEFDASSKMTVLIGNAGGLEVSLNGKPVRPIGARGEVLRLILTPHAVYVVPRTSPTSRPTPDDEEQRPCDSKLPSCATTQ